MAYAMPDIGLADLVLAAVGGWAGWETAKGSRTNKTVGLVVGAVAAPLTSKLIKRLMAPRASTTKYHVILADGSIQRFETSDPSTIPTQDQLPQGARLVMGWDQPSSTGEADLNVRAQLTLREPSRHWKRY